MCIRDSYKPDLEGFMTTNAAGAQGQGIAMAQAVGAALSLIHILEANSFIWQNGYSSSRLSLR